MKFTHKVLADYQGWTNLPTYNVHLLFANDKALLSDALKALKGAKQDPVVLKNILKEHGINEQGKDINWQEIADHLIKKSVAGASWLRAVMAGPAVNIKTGQDLDEDPFVYTYSIDMNERGIFQAHVEDPNGKTVYTINNENEDGDTGEIPEVEDGFMKHGQDTSGLEKHLKDLKVMPKDASLKMEK